MLGVYVHIPFCKSICTYCDFCKMLYNSKYVFRYLEQLECEIDKRYSNEIIDTIYIGGGTPSCLSLTELERLFKILSKIKLKDKHEYTIECNIENINQEKLELFKKYGINRISFGVESFDKEIQKKLGRCHNEEMIFNNVNMTKKYFDNINVDLIYGVTEDIEVVKKDIDKLLKLDVNHVSCYSLILEEHTKLYIDKCEYISEDVDRLMFEYISNTLTSNGYKHYEVSNYAKIGYQSSHNKNYWLNGSYFGFGLGAVSFIDNYRISNTKNMSKYLNRDYVADENYEDIKMSKENDLILGLRLIDGIDIEKYNRKYNDQLLDRLVIKELINDNYLEVSNGKIKCRYQYIYLLNNILEKIIGSDL